MCNMLMFCWSKYCFHEAGDLTLYLTIHECMTNYPQVKTMHYYLSEFLSWLGSFGWFLLGIFTYNYSQWSGIQSSEGSTGLDVQDSSLTWVTFIVGSWLRGQLRLHLECLHVSFPCVLGYLQQDSWLFRGSIFVT